MIGAHLRERFFQRYGQELTVDILRELRLAAAKTESGTPDPTPGRERVRFTWRGLGVYAVWVRQQRMFITFLPPDDPGQRISACRADPVKRVRRDRRRW